MEIKKKIQLKLPQIQKIILINSKKELIRLDDENWDFGGEIFNNFEVVDILVHYFQKNEKIVYKNIKIKNYDKAN